MVWFKKSPRLFKIPPERGRSPRSPPGAGASVGADANDQTPAPEKSLHSLRECREKLHGNVQLTRKFLFHKLRPDLPPEEAVLFFCFPLGGSGARGAPERGTPGRALWPLIRFLLRGATFPRGEGRDNVRPFGVIRGWCEKFLQVVARFRATFALHYTVV